MGKHTMVAFIALFCFVINLPAQKSKLKKAQKYMESLNYSEAIDMYLKILTKDDLPEIKIDLANAYLKINDYTNAESWFGQVINISETDAANYFQYGKVLLHNGKCEAAQEVFLQFQKLKPYDLRNSTLKDVCSYLKQLETESPDIKLSDLTVNNYFTEALAPAFYKDGIVFGAVKPLDSLGKRQLFDLYHVTYTEENQNLIFDKPEKFSIDLGNIAHRAIATFTSDQKEVYLTQNQADAAGSGLIRLEIVFSINYESGEWSTLLPLPFNNQAYSVAHPSLSSDGNRLFFSSDMPGGLGGKDIYVTSWENGRWQDPINLGPTVNTTGDELFPFYHVSNKLYFSSDGHLGLGGQDIFVVNENENGLWEDVKNLGSPTNSPFDDFGIILNQDESNGFLTTNRKGIDRIFHFKRNMKKELWLAAVDNESELILSNFELKTSTEEIAIEKTEHRFYKIELPNNDCYDVFAIKESFDTEKIRLCNKDVITGDTLYFLMQKEEQLVSRIEGTVIDQFSGLPVPNVTLELTTPTSKNVQEFQSNSKGQFSIDLQGEYCYSIKAKKESFFTKIIDQSYCVKDKEVKTFLVDLYMQPFKKTTVASAQMLTSKNGTKAFEISQKVYENDNSVAYLLNIYYDSGRASVRKEGLVELEKLLALLKENTDIKLEISSHTDSKGSASANEKLSQRRANAIVTYLVHKGINRKQLIGKGYGENQPVNHCVDGISCSEEEYQLNRRTEFKVLGSVE
jgi:outer membrane protein OmpA-like peptidoglycan-associated protein/tetratricopeptide (TPR) repeat protein